MIAELLLVLAGHPSSLFLSSGSLDPAFEEFLHPGEQKSLEYISHVANCYLRIKRATATQSSLATSSESLASMCAAIRKILADYEALIVETEARILQRDDEIVSGPSFVPLASLRAIFSPWDAPLSGLDSLLEHLQQNVSSGKSMSTGNLIDLLLERSKSGVERISEIMNQLSLAVQRVWQMHLIAYLVHGTLTQPHPFAFSNPYRLNAEVMPKCVSVETRDSIVYIGRAIMTVKSAHHTSRQQQQQLPRNLAVTHTKMLSKVLPQDRHEFDVTLAQIRVNVSEWLWTTVLTRKDVEEAVDSLANYFLLRNGEFSVSLIREIERLKLSRLTPRAASRITPGISIIREQDLSLALLRASLGTTAQHDPTLSRLRFTLPTGPVRPFLSSFSANPDLSNLSMANRSTAFPEHVDFTTTLLGTRLELGYSLTWPLDLFLTPTDIHSYTNLFAYFSSIRHTHQRVMECWISLSNAQRARRRWVKFGEGGDPSSDATERRDLLRCGWGVVREMVWFLDAMWAYICHDVVEGQYLRLKASLKPPGASARRRRSGSNAHASAAATDAPGTSTRGRRSSIGSRPSSQPRPPSIGTGLDPGADDARPPPDATPALDFSTLRSMHSAYLYALNAGSLLSNPGCASTIKSVMELCEVFVATVERWGGDVLPDLLGEGSIAVGGDTIGKLVRERAKVVREVNETLNGLLETFYEQLSLSLSSQPTHGNSDMTTNNLSTFFGNPFLNGNTTVGGKRRMAETNRATDAEVRRNAERLLLRLDFNNGFSKSGIRSSGMSILREGGLA